MEILLNILIVVYVINCLALIIVTMIQSKEDSGLSSTITGSSSNNFFEKNKGKTKGGKLKRATISLAISFVILTIIMGIMYVIK